VRGFTIVELVAVLVLVGVLAVVAVPRLQAALAPTGTAWRDQVLAALQYARSQAQGHRRLVCATLATGEVRLAMAVTNPASACTHVLNGPDGDARWAHDERGLALSVAPAGALYFQPDGRISRDGAGASLADLAIAIAGETAIAVSGETGHVQ
jgi:prepilin-type N-terminal cleavage/methylation domain-containing protein